MSRCPNCNRLLPGYAPSWALPCMCNEAPKAPAPEDTCDGLTCGEYAKCATCSIIKVPARAAAPLPTVTVYPAEDGHAVCSCPNCQAECTVLANASMTDYYTYCRACRRSVKVLVVEGKRPEALVPATPKTEAPKTPAKRRVRVTCNVRADFERVLGPHGWTIWRTICATIPCSPLRARKGTVVVSNYADKAWGCHDGQCVCRVAVNLATGEVVDGGYVSTGECAINERPERTAPVDLATTPTNWAHGWFKYAYGTPSLELEVPDHMMGNLE